MAKKPDSAIDGLNFIWLEITEKCNLKCIHCYANSEPAKPLFGNMKSDDWMRVLRDSYDMGCRDVQFIGGEPTLHPDLESFVRYSRELGYNLVEIFTNATRLNFKSLQWMQECKVNIATSFYSYDPKVHDYITKNSGSFRKTVNGIKAVLETYIPLRVGIVEMQENQGHLTKTAEYLESIGVNNIGKDHIREFGRAECKTSQSSNDNLHKLCGACWKGKLCVTSKGITYPCIMARNFSIGSVLESDIKTLVSSDSLKNIREKIYEDVWIYKVRSPDCNPDCNPRTDCSPIWWCRPDRTCAPDN